VCFPRVVRSEAVAQVTRDDATANTHLSRLGVNPVVRARLTAFAEDDGVTLREMVRYILGDYRPATYYDPPSDD